MKTVRNVALWILIAGWVGLAIAAEPDPLRVTFDIARQPLREALTAFAKQTGLQVMLREEDVEAGRQTARTVKGDLSPRQALEQLLEKTDLIYEFVTDRMVRISAKEEAKEARTEVGRDAGPLIRIAQAEKAPAGNASQAQPSALPMEEEEQGTQLEEIVVTGTHIRGATSTSPMIILDRAAIERSGRSSIGDVLRTLPEMFNGGQNVGNLGTGASNQDLTGASSPNLRGLGSGSTLTLVNGHRLAFNGYQGGPDASIVPLAAVERIEVVTDGASAIYGSDAVAGVVNLVLRNQYEGAETRLYYGDTTQGGGAQQQFSQLFGTAWTGGNAVLNYEYRKADPLFASERSFSRNLSTSRYSLLPEEQKHSVFGSLRQALNSSVSLFFDGLYTERKNESSSSESLVDALFKFRDSQYALTAGADFALNDNWQLRMFSTLASDEGKSGGFTIPVGSQTSTPIFPAHYDNGTWSIEGTLSGNLAELATGPLAIAIGAGYRKTEFDKVYSDPATPEAFDTHSARSSEFGYGELRVPLVDADRKRPGLRRLEASVALRTERYSDFGSAANPKIGLIYEPTEQLAWRVTWGTAYRAPELFRQYGEPQRYLLSLGAPTPAGQNTFLLAFGSNTQLKAEEADTWNTSIDYSPPFAPDLALKLSGYLIAYKDRIDLPFFPFFVALDDPDTYSQYLTNDPTTAQQDAAIGNAPLQNFTDDGAPYDPASVAFILDERYQNISRVNTKGIDLSLNYNRGPFGFFSNTSFLRQSHRLLASSPEQTVSATIFNAPKWKSRTGATWQAGDFASMIALNYTGSFENNVSATQSRIDRWITADVQLAYESQRKDYLKGLQARLSIQNVFDKEPPFVAADSFIFLSGGLGFDPTNASAAGRVASIELVKSW